MDTLIDLFKDNVYWFLLLLATTEGPITSFVSAGFAAQGNLRLDYVVYIMLMGDVLGDVCLYLFGRFFGSIKYLQKFDRFSKEKKLMDNAFARRPFFYLLFVKITPYLATPSLFFLGLKKYPFGLFFLYSLLISSIVKLVYIATGYYGSISLQQLSWFLQSRKQVVLYIIGAVLLFWLIRWFYRSIGLLIKTLLKK